MKKCKFKLMKVMPCVYEVWSVDEFGRLVEHVGMFGKFSSLCKYDQFFVDYYIYGGRVVSDWQWLFDSTLYESRIFDDFVSGRCYVLGSGA